MTRAAPFRQSDVSRLVRGAIKGGLTEGSFQVRLIDGQPTILPFSAGAAPTAAEDVEKRMREAFGET